jgi:hypothetical protein
MLGCRALLLVCLVVMTAACSAPSQQAPPAAADQPAAAGQPAGGATAPSAALDQPAASATAPSAAPGQPAASATATPPAAPGRPAASATAAPSAAPGQPTAAPPVPKPAPPPPPPPRKFTLAAGTVLSIQTNYTLSTDKQSAGDKFEASLVEPIRDGDWVIAKEGAQVDGLIVASTKGGRVKGSAELEVAITGLTLSDGQHIRIETVLASSAAKSEGKKDAGKVAVTTGVGAIVGLIAGGGKGAAIGAAAGGVGGTALVLGTRGKPAEIPARSLLQFQTTRPVEITEKKK